jgi:hypothetical protein
MTVLTGLVRKIKTSFETFIHFFAACEEGQGICAHLMVIFSVLLIFVTLPFSLLFVVKVVQVLQLFH